MTNREKLYFLIKDSAANGWFPNNAEILKLADRLVANGVAPVVPGRWISFLDGDSIMPERFYKCSRCGRVERRKEPYCHCGAKMDK